MKVSGAIKSVLHGVTTNNLVTAGSEYWIEQTNVVPRVDEGLSKRPAAKTVGYMGTALASGDFVKKFIIHDVAYFLVVRKSPLTLTVTREDGVNYTVTDTAGDTYLNDITEDTLRLAVHGELVFLVNRNKQVLMTNNTDNYITNSLLYFKNVITAGAVINVTAVNTSNAKVTKQVTVAASPSNMPGNLASSFATAFNSETDMIAVSRSGVMQIVLSNGANAQITVESDLDEESIVAVNDTVADFADLPQTAYIGKRVAVKHSDSPEGTEVYMEAVQESYKDYELAVNPPDLVWPTATDSITFQWYNSVGTPLGTGVEPSTTDQEYTLRGTASEYWTVDGWRIYSFMAAKISPTYPSRAVDMETDVAPYWSILTGPYPDAPAYTYGTKIAVRLAPVSSQQDTYCEVLVEQREPDFSSVPDIYLNEGYFMSPTPDYNDDWGPLPVCNVEYAFWFDEEGAVPSTNTALCQVRWIEVTKAGIKYAPNNETWPHMLTPPASGTVFSYTAPNWIDRKAGDTISNPAPPFVNNTIEDIVIFQNRLAVLSKDTVSMSASGDVFNFFRDTVTELLSKHPVSIRSTSALSAKLNHFVYHNRDLIATTKRQQYKISGSQPITPQTASMELTTTYNASETVSPESVGSNVYIPNHNNGYLNVNRYTGATQNLNPDSADNITAHVDKYIANTVNMIAGLPNHGLLFFASSTGQDIYCCNYDTDVSRSESTRFAWFKWTGFTDDTTYKIRSLATVKNTLLVVIETTAGLMLLEFDANARSFDYSLDYLYTEASVTSTITLPTGYGILSDLVVVQGTGCPSPGDYAAVTTYAGGVITLTDDMGGGTVHVGREYTVRAIPNLLTLRDQGGTVNKAAKLRIQKFILTLVDTGSCEAIEQSPHDTYVTQAFSGLVNNDLETILGDAAIVNEDFKIGFKQQADVGTLLITSTSWLPLTIAQVDWVGNYTQRGRRF